MTWKEEKGKKKEKNKNRKGKEKGKERMETAQNGKGKDRRGN